MSLPWLSDPRRPLTSPREIPKLEAWFDALDTSSMLTGAGATITDGGSVALWADKSGNSGTLCYVSGTAASNSVSSPNKSVTGNQTFTLDVGLDDYTPGSDLTVVSKLSGNDGFAILVLTTGVVRLRVGDGASVTNVDSSAAFTMTDLRRHTIGIAWTDGVGASFTQDGAAVGTAVAAAKTLTNAAVACTIGTITGRIYRVQIGSVYDFNPAGTTVKKLTNGDTLTTGGDVWTLASTGATGGRIAGERDLFQGTAANRPVWLQYAGTKYGWLNATSGNSFTCPTVALTGDLDIQADIALADWSPSAAQGIVSKFGAAGNRGFRFEIGITGLLTFVWSSDGTAFTAVAASEAIVLADGARKRVRCILDVDDGGVYTIKFFQSDDGSTWTQVGTTTTGGATTSIFNSTALLEVGQYAQSNTPASGKFYSASVSATIPADPLTSSGTPLRSFNPALYTSGTTFTASTGEVWTINGGAHIVTRTGLYGNGSTHYLQSAQWPLSQPETRYATFSQISWTNAARVVAGVVPSSSLIYQITSSPGLSIYGGTSGLALADALPLQTCGMIAGVYNSSLSSVRKNRGAASTGNIGVLASSGVTLFADSGGGAPSNAFVSEVAIYSAAHDTATQDRMALYAGRKWGFSV